MPRRILVVDSDADTRNVIAELLRQDGYDVDLAHNGFEGLEVLQKMGEQPCLILVNWRLPHMSGPEFCRRVMVEHKLAIPIILGTGFDSHKCEGAQGFLRTPFNYNELIDLVHQHCGPALKSR